MVFVPRRHVLACSLATALAVGLLSSPSLQAQQPKQARAQAVSGATASHVAPRRNHALAGGGQGGVIQVALRQSRLETAPSRSHHSPAALPHLPQLHSEVAFVQDLDSATVLYDQNSDEARPIASISKLMTALIVAEAKLPMDEMLTIADEDVDRVRYSRSRLAVGTQLSRADMLHLALMSSENRAAHALSRHYSGGLAAFVRAMNDKALATCMLHTQF